MRLLTLIGSLLIMPLMLHAQHEIHWQHLSTTSGQIPLPGKSHQQTGVSVHDFDKDGLNDFIIGFREVAPALVWYRRYKKGWKRYVIDSAYLTVEAGGVVYDIDH